MIGTGIIIGLGVLQVGIPGEAVLVASDSNQFFAYTALGNEGVSIPISLPTQRSGAPYGVIVSAETEPDTFTFTTSAKTKDGFTLRTSSQLPIGTVVLMFVATLG